MADDNREAVGCFFALVGILILVFCSRWLTSLRVGAAVAVAWPDVVIYHVLAVVAFVPCGLAIINAHDWGLERGGQTRLYGYAAALGVWVGILACLQVLFLVAVDQIGPSELFSERHGIGLRTWSARWGWSEKTHGGEGGSVLVALNFLQLLVLAIPFGIWYLERDTRSGQSGAGGR